MQTSIHKYTHARIHAQIHTNLHTYTYPHTYTAAAPAPTPTSDGGFIIAGPHAHNPYPALSTSKRSTMSECAYIVLIRRPRSCTPAVYEALSDAWAPVLGDMPIGLDKEFLGNGMVYQNTV